MIRSILYAGLFTVSFATMGFSSLGDPLFEGEQIPVRKAFLQNEIVHRHLRDAPSLAAREGRELHIFLGAAPAEAHIRRMIEQEAIREAKDSASFKAPVRIFITKDHFVAKPEDSTPLNPIFFSDFNSFQEWDHLASFIYPDCKDQRDAKGIKKFNGPVDKIYFDWSVVKFINWSALEMMRISILCKPSGVLYVPDVRLASQCVFAISDTTVGQYEALKAEKTQESMVQLMTLPHAPFLEQRNREIFLRGFSMTALDRREGNMYIYNSSHLLYDYNYRAATINPRADKLVGALKFEEVGSNQDYPDTGVHLRDAQGMPENFFDVKTYVKVSKG